MDSRVLVRQRIYTHVATGETTFVVAVRSRRPSTSAELLNLCVTQTRFEKALGFTDAIQLN